MIENEIVELCKYSFGREANKSYVFTKSYSIIRPQLKALKKQYPFNTYIIDCAEYYGDDDIVKLSSLIINRNKTLMNDYMNIKLNNDNMKKDCFESHNIVFIVNIDSCKEACKNLIPFMNSIMERELKYTHIFFISCEDYDNLLHFNCDVEYDMNDFIPAPYRTYENENNTTLLIFKNYKILSKYKKYLFPLSKIKITKKKIEKHINNIIFIKTADCITDNAKISNDYKTILIDYLTDDGFSYWRVFSVSHYDNIPLILYENIDLITSASLKKDSCKMHRLHSKVRQLCIDYYCHTNDPDMYLFKKSNLYFFLCGYKKLLYDLDIKPLVKRLVKLNFTKYYSNRAAEIQYQKLLSPCDVFSHMDDSNSIKPNRK